MVRNTIGILFVLLVAGTATHAADAWTGGGGETEGIGQFDYWGLSIAPEPAQVGDDLELVGVLSPETTWVPIPMDFGSNEYTVHIHGLVLRSRKPSGPLMVSTFEGGTAEIYRDPSFNAPFRHNTPANLVPPFDPDVVPAHFADGELIVQFAFNRLITLFLPQSGIGSVAYTDSELRVVGGSAMALLGELNMVAGWHMGGGFTDDPRAVPEGYGYRYDTLFRWESPQPVEPTTWGEIKARFN